MDLLSSVCHDLINIHDILNQFCMKSLNISWYAEDCKMIYFCLVSTKLPVECDPCFGECVQNTRDDLVISKRKVDH